MKYDDLRYVFARLGEPDLPPPNHAGWTHIACPFAPWKHRGGVDRSKGFAVKVEDNGPSAFTCPVCKMHGRIEHLARTLGVLRNVDYSEVVRDIERIEVSGAMFLPPWDQRHTRMTDRVEVLPDPLDDLTFDPYAIFDDIGDHPDASNFCLSRYVTPHGAEKADMRFDPDKRRIVFPVWDGDGNLYGFTGRTIIPDHKPKVLDYANLPKRLLILGEHRWVPSKPIILVEGLFAYARFLEEDVDEDMNVGAVLGSVLTPGKAARIRNWNLPTYLCFDPDPAGDQGIHGTLKNRNPDPHGEPVWERDVESGAVWQLVDHVPVFAPPYPEGVDDPDFLTRDMVRDMVAAARPEPKPRPARKLHGRPLFSR